MAPLSSPLRRSTVIIVGSGITGLITAYTAAQAGYQVTVLSKSPDPRRSPAATSFEAATWDGFVNRFITLAEGHPYLTLPPEATVTHGDVAADFQQDLTEGGFLALPRSQWSPETRKFLAQRQSIDPYSRRTLWLLNEYLDENRASLVLWYDLLTQVLRHHPQIYPHLSLHSQGIDRLYDCPAAFRQARQMQEHQGILKAVYPAQTLASNPALSLYQRPGLEGGVLTQYGVSFDVHGLGQQWLLPELERLGVQLRLGQDHRVVSLDRNDQGQIQGLTTAEGHTYSAHHYLLHPGAYGDPQLLAQTPAQGQLAAVQGLWLRVQQGEERWPWGHLSRPCKIHGAKAPIVYQGQTYPGQVTDLNAMVQRRSQGWDLVIGSGYIFRGLYPFPEGAAVQRAEALALEALVQVVNRVYGLTLVAERLRQGTDPQGDLPSLGCMRSWSPDDRELRTLVPTAAGGVLLIQGGGNTGSTTKAPFLSQVAVAFLQTFDGAAPPPDTWADTYEHLRYAHRKSTEAVNPIHWQALEDGLQEAVDQAQAPDPSCLHGV